MLKGQNSIKVISVIIISFFYNIFSVNFCFPYDDCKEFIDGICYNVQNKTNQEKLECYKNIDEDSVGGNCVKYLKNKINQLKDQGIFKDEDIYLINNIYETYCKNDVLNFCKAKQKKNHIIVNNKINCLKKLIKKERNLTINCKIALSNFFKKKNDNLYTNDSKKLKTMLNQIEKNNKIKELQD